MFLWLPVTPQSGTKHSSLGCRWEERVTSHHQNWPGEQSDPTPQWEWVGHLQKLGIKGSAKPGAHSVRLTLWDAVCLLVKMGLRRSFLLRVPIFNIMFKAWYLWQWPCLRCVHWVSSVKPSGPKTELTQKIPFLRWPVKAQECAH